MVVKYQRQSSLNQTCYKVLIWDNSSYHHIIFHILSFGECFFVIFLYYLIILIMLITYFSTVFFNLVSLISLCASYLVHHLLWIVFIFFLNLVSPTSSCARRMGASTGSDFARWRPDWAETFKMNVRADLIILCDYIIGNIPKSLSPYLPKLSSLKKVTTPYL